MKQFVIDCLEPDDVNGIVEVKVNGFLDAHTVDEFEQSMNTLLERQYARFVLDLAGLAYISSAGIGALMVLLQQLRRRQGDMVILQPSQKVYKILDLLGFTRIFYITDDHGSALQALGSN